MKMPSSTAEAVQIQNVLRGLVRLEDDVREPLRFVAGLDVGYDPARNLAKAAAVVLDWESLKLHEELTVEEEVHFPYVPGLLSFREAPVAMKALAGLRERPDLVMVDGHGIAHPRRLGIAAHIGVLSDLPTIGVAKKKLCGAYAEPGEEKGAQSTLSHKGERIGTVLRSREGVKPVFISPGHQVSQERAVDFVLHCLGRYKLPEPTRLADKLSKFR